MKTYLDSEATAKKISEDGSLIVELSGGLLVKVNKLMPAAQDPKIGAKVLLRYSRKNTESGMPIDPVAMRIVSSI